MRFGLLFRPQDPPDGARAVERWQEILETAKLAERVGFDGVFVPEHHGMPEWILSSPWAPLGALAAVTERVEIGTTIHVLPLQNPMSVAENAAMVDVLSNGRMRLGVGLGFVPEESELFGLDPADRSERFDEAIGLLQRALAGEVVDHDGAHYRARGGVFPRPVGAELWIGGMAPAGARRAARFGCPWATGLVHSLPVMRYLTGEYRAAGERHGTADRLRVCLLRDAWIADSLEQVEEEWWPFVRPEHFWLFSNLPSWVARLEPYGEAGLTEEAFTFDRHRADRLIVGSPADCIETIRRFRDELAMDYLIVSFRQGGGPTFEQEFEAVRRFGEEVIPAFR